MAKVNTGHFSCSLPTLLRQCFSLVSTCLASRCATRTLVPASQVLRLQVTVTFNTHSFYASFGDLNFSSDVVYQKLNALSHIPSPAFVVLIRQSFLLLICSYSSDVIFCQMSLDFFFKHIISSASIYLKGPCCVNPQVMTRHACGL